MSKSGRRQFLEGLAGALLAGLLRHGCTGPPATQPLPAARVAHVGLLGVGPPPGAPAPPLPNTEAFKQGLAELGYEEGRNLQVDVRYAAPDRELFLPLATELVQARVDVLVTIPLPALEAARQVAGNIPIVIVYSGDPVTSGLVETQARPGGTITGLASMDSQLSGKRLEYLSEALAGPSRIAVLWNPAQPDKLLDYRETTAAAQKLGVQLISVEARTLGEVQGGFVAAKQAGAEGVIVLEDDLMFRERTPIAELELRERLPAMYAIRQHVVAGGLLAYGPNTPAMFRRAAGCVDRILKGERPADIPIEQPMRFDFVINLKTAQALGITIPQPVLLDATEVIQ